MSSTPLPSIALPHTEPAPRPAHYPAILWATLILTLLLSWLLWEQDVKNRVFPRNFGVVEANSLFRSGRLSEAQAESTLRTHNIGTVISLITDGDDPKSAAPMKDAIEKLKIERHVFSMNGNGLSTPDRYADAVAAIHNARQAGKAVLVHCKAGAQRTGGVIATYELLVRKATPAFATEQLLLHGHDPEDNPKLIPWLNENLPTIAQHLVDRGVLKTLPPQIPRLTP